MFRRNYKKEESLWQKIKSYKLHNNVYVLCALIAAVLISTMMFYHLYSIGNDGFLFNLMIAVATSLLASVFCTISDLILKFKECESDKLIKGLHEYGISDLHFDKQALLEDLLEDCRRTFWISGYRLILTGRITPCIEDAVRRGVKIRMLICPPWNEAYRLVYGKSGSTMANYCKVFGAVLDAAESIAEAGRLCEIRFSTKPLFNDTYKVDDYLITGSYLHNRDKEHNRITASDFFTFDLARKSALYKLIDSEYQTLWEEAEERLVWEDFSKICERLRTEDMLESDRVKLMSGCCEPIIDVTEDTVSAKLS